MKFLVCHEFGDTTTGIPGAGGGCVLAGDLANFPVFGYPTDRVLGSDFSLDTSSKHTWVGGSSRKRGEATRLLASCLVFFLARHHPATTKFLMSNEIPYEGSGHEIPMTLVGIAMTLVGLGIERGSAVAPAQERFPLDAVKVD